MTNKDLLRSLRPALSVGAISANLMSLGDDITLLEACGVQLLHFDVMDGDFVPLLTVGPPFIKAVRTSMLKDVHLEIRDPLEGIPDYAAAGADIITIHPDSCDHPHRVLQRIGEMTNANDASRGILRGVALNPSTPVAALEPLLPMADLVCLVGVNPGFPGQKFIPATLERGRAAREMIAEAGADVLLAIDGGVTKDSIGAIASLGPDIVVTGSAVFDGRAVAQNVRAMTAALEAHG